MNALVPGGLKVIRTLFLLVLVGKVATSRRVRGDVLSLASSRSTSDQLEKDAFSIIVLPDTQFYTGAPDHADIFTQQTQWIAEQVLSSGNPRNIVFVSHMGDLVDRGVAKVQWERADASMSVLGPRRGPFVVPYSVLPGNHDFNVPMDVVDWSPKSVKSHSADNFVSFFGPDRFQGASWYKGADPSGLNSFQIFKAGDMHILHLALEWQPTLNLPKRALSPLAWATQVLADHPGVPTILSTHEYLVDIPGGRSEAGDELFDALVRSSDQIFLVLCGHFHKAGGYGGEWQQISTNDHGHSVIEILSDYQDYSNGGDGWLRILTFHPQDASLRVQTYSPALKKFNAQNPVTSINDHTLTHFTVDLNFTERFSDQPSRSVAGRLCPNVCFAILVLAQLLASSLARSA